MRNNKAITLIALIITIIIMLILVAVTVNVAIDRNLFGKAEEAVDKTNQKVGKLQQEVDYYTDKLNEYSNKDTNIETSYRVVKEYYINGVITATVTSGEVIGNMGDVIKGVDLNNQNSNWSYYTIDGIRYEFTYAGSNPESLILSENSSDNVITLRYERKNRTYTVVYTDGTGGEIFGDETHENLKSGDFTPEFSGNLNRTGYIFRGWAPAINPRVSSADAENGIITYTATWQKNG